MIFWNQTPLIVISGSIENIIPHYAELITGLVRRIIEHFQNIFWLGRYQTVLWLEAWCRIEKPCHYCATFWGWVPGFK